jgi:hypothetical protein
MDLDTMCTKDLARTATLVMDALRNAPDEAELFVETEFGPATVITDGAGADVVLHDRGATVHVRRES